jgi:uncharacterized membrane protein YkvA (DUF1232 family)
MTGAEHEQAPPEAERQSFLSLLPRVATFLYHLARDPRVPWSVKASVVALAAYIASPFDLIPDWIPGAGYVDDALLFAIVLNYVFAAIPEDVIIEHWGEDVETLRRMRPRRPPATD